jgi:cilia- and flagella-associated protein 57
VFGFRSDVRDPVHFLDEGTLLYPAGHAVVTYSLESRTQRFIPAAVDTESIQALALTASRRYLAVAERAERGVVTIYDVSMLKRRKVLVSSDSNCKVCKLPYSIPTAATLRFWAIF